MKHEVIFDTETTGLLKPSAVDLSEQPYIVEFAAVKVRRDGDEIQIIDQISMFIKPPIPLSTETKKITGITDAMLISAKSFPLVWKEIAQFFINVDRVIAHNLGFDISMLANELMRIDSVLKFPWPMDHYCTVENSMHIDQRRLSLKNLHIELLGHDFADAHRAMNDVQALYRCYAQGLKVGVFK